MNIILNVLTHSIIIFGIVLMLGFIIAMIAKGHPNMEKLIRGIALIAGFLIYFTIRAIGISIPTWIVEALQHGKMMFAVAGLLVPSVFGIVITWACLDAWRRKNDLSARLVILISTFILFLFTDVYVAVFRLTTNARLDINLLPNLAFVIGLSLFIVFNAGKQRLDERHS